MHAWSVLTIKQCVLALVASVVIGQTDIIDWGFENALFLYYPVRGYEDDGKQKNSFTQQYPTSYQGTVLLIRGPDHNNV